MKRPISDIIFKIFEVKTGEDGYIKIEGFQKLIEEESGEVLTRIIVLSIEISPEGLSKLFVANKIKYIFENKIN